jgi:hypothetical protein
MKEKVVYLKESSKHTSKTNFMNMLSFGFESLNEGEKETLIVLLKAFLTNKK